MTSPKQQMELRAAWSSYTWF